MPSFDYRSGPFLLNSSDDGDTNDDEKIPSMSIGSGSLLGDMSMPRLQFRDWMGKPNANDNIVPEEQTIMERADLDLPERGSTIPFSGSGDTDDNNEAFVMTESMVTFVLGSAVLFCAAILIILLVATCVRLYRRRQSRREQRDLEAQKRIAAAAAAPQLRHHGGNDGSERKPYLYPVRSLDFSRQQLNEILGKMDPKSNPLDF